MPLTGLRFLATGEDRRVACAARLLRWLGAEVQWGTDVPVAPGAPIAGALDGAGTLEPGGGFPIIRPDPARHPALAWAASGVMALTGDPAGPPLLVAGNQAAHLDGAALAASLLARVHGGDLALDGLALTAERAAIAGLGPGGMISAGGASRLLAARDGWVAVSLTRPADYEVLPAWLGCQPSASDPWGDVAAHLAGRSAAEAVAAAQLVGLAAAVLAADGGFDEQLAARRLPWPPPPWLIDSQPPGPDGGHPPNPADGSHPPNQVDAQPPRPAVAGQPPKAAFATRPARPAARHEPPLVVDLSSLWAGPLCASLLGAAGARVIKVESAHRPDGARLGPPAFFDLLNAGKRSLTLPLGQPEGTAELRRLLEAADVVIESARPRVMEQWGIDVEDFVARQRGLTWVSITAYGRRGPWANRVGFGDDTAVAGGLVALGPDGRPRFCGDAYADPAAGLHAAVAALAGLASQRSHLIDVALRDVAGHLRTEAGPRSPARTVTDGTDWWVEAEGERQRVEPPRARPARGPGPSLGADSAAVRRAWGR